MAIIGQALYLPCAKTFSTVSLRVYDKVDIVHQGVAHYLNIKVGNTASETHSTQEIASDKHLILLWIKQDSDYKPC